MIEALIEDIINKSLALLGLLACSYYIKENFFTLYYPFPPRSQPRLPGGGIVANREEEPCPPVFLILYLLAAYNTITSALLT
jgi:hypothetical protein